MRSAHRVAYEIAHGVQLADARVLRADTPCVLHTCDNPPCCNPAHLRLGTQRENIRDASQRKRLAFGDDNPMRRLPTVVRRGEANNRAKLRVADVLNIRLRSAHGDIQAVIASDYGLAISTIQRIVYRQLWKHC